MERWDEQTISPIKEQGQPVSPGNQVLIVTYKQGYKQEWPICKRLKITTLGQSPLPQEVRKRVYQIVHACASAHRPLQLPSGPCEITHPGQWLEPAKIRNTVFSIKASKYHSGLVRKLHPEMTWWDSEQAHCKLMNMGSISCLGSMESANKCKSQTACQRNDPSYLGVQMPAVTYVTLESLN